MRFIISFIILLVLIVAGIWVYGEYQKNNQNNPPQEEQTPNEEETPNPNTADKNLYETISVNPDLKTLKSLLDRTTFKDSLATDAKYTLFFPQELLLSAESKAEINKLVEGQNVVEIETFIKKHIVEGEFKTTKILEENLTLKNLNGTNLQFKVDNGVLFVNDIEALDVDIQAKNGTMFLLKDVLK